MFDLFPKKKSVDEHLESNEALYASIKKEASDLASGIVNGVYEIIALKNELQHQLDENAKLLDEKKNLEAILKSIEEDGTEEHNNAIKLRQENAKLKDEIAKWEKDWDEQNKVIIHLNERVNEIDSDVNRDLTDEVFCLKNDYAVLRANHQIVQNNYKKCTEQRDEFKHQLNAANKEIEILKKDIAFTPWAASDLALRVVKLEKQIEELKIVNTTNPYSAMKPDGTLKAINCIGHIPTNGYVPSNQDEF
jgi:chromosome segregation ATPase